MQIDGLLCLGMVRRGTSVLVMYNGWLSLRPPHSLGFLVINKLTWMHACKEYGVFYLCYGIFEYIGLSISI